MPIVAYACIDPYLEKPPDADSWGQPIDRLYLDQGHPIQHRPILQQLLQDCATTPPEAVLIRRLGDLGESAMAVMACVDELEAQGITVQALDDSYRSSHISARLTTRSNLMQLATEIQAQQRSHQLQAGHAHNRINILPPPGRAPYGYRRGRDRYALDRTTAPVVKAFFEQFLLFGSIRGAVRFLEKTYGKRISASTGQRWLTHPVYRGDLVYKDNHIIRDTHTPIISREEAAQVDRLLRRNRRLPPKTASAQRSLAGLVQCQECQSKLKVSRVTRPRQSQEYLYLRPMNCGRSAKACKAISYEAVLDKTIHQVCHALPNAVAALDGPPVGSIKGVLLSQIQQKEAALEQIPALLKEEILDTATANLRTYTLRSEISDLKQQMSQLPPENLLQIVQTLSIPQFWEDLSEAERRVYLREFIKTVLITRTGNDWAIEIQFVF
ncbi:MAG: recombinase family protein [Leptolyngbya sp. SIO1D8]|nr:recombinase family protein [Leptolyngbya sp. SIO1D8]